MPLVLAQAQCGQPSLADLLPDGSGTVRLGDQTTMPAAVLARVVRGEDVDIREVDSPAVRSSVARIDEWADSDGPARTMLTFRAVMAIAPGRDSRELLAAERAAGDAERIAARRLGVPFAVVVAASLATWGHGLTEERDTRATQRAGPGAQARSAQAARGHVTRELYSELAPAIQRYRKAREHAQRFDRKIDAQRWIDEATTALVTGQYVDPRAGRITFRECAEQWRATAPHGPSTAYLVVRALEKHIYPAIGDLPISAIRTTRVQALATSWGARLAPSTVRVLYGYVVAVFGSAVRDKMIATSPCDGVRLPAARRKQVEIPPMSILDDLREALPARLRAVVDLVAGSGLRQAEVFGLEVDGLDFLRSQAVDVHQQLVTLAGIAPYLWQPKSDESARVVPLAQVTLGVFAAHLAAFPVPPVMISDRIEGHKPVQREARLVFTHEDGRPMSRADWSHIWQPAARAAGLPPRTGLHALRHLYASLLIRHGESVKTVQKRLGHSSAAITLDTYSHLWPDADDRTRDAVQAAMNALADNVRTSERSS